MKAEHVFNLTISETQLLSLFRQLPVRRQGILIETLMECAEERPIFQTREPADERPLSPALRKQVERLIDLMGRQGVKRTRAMLDAQEELLADLDARVE